MTDQRSPIGYTAAAAYVGCVVAANWLVVRFGVVPIGLGLRAPAGVFMVGVALTLRDVVQRRLGRLYVVAAIAAGAVLSFMLADDLPAGVAPKAIVALPVASAAAFLVSELLDFAAFTPLIERGRWLAAVALSNTVGAVADSALFLWLAFGSLDFIAGQIVGKLAVTAVTLVALAPARRSLLAVE